MTILRKLTLLKPLLANSSARKRSVNFFLESFPQVSLKTTLQA
jgi:hypothetical protein